MSYNPRGLSPLGACAKGLMNDQTIWIFLRGYLEILKTCLFAWVATKGKIPTEKMF